MTYEINGQFNGRERTLTIINESETEYKVYWDALYLGTITPEHDEVLGIVWTTNDAALLGCSQELGECIERADS